MPLILTPTIRSHYPKLVDLIELKQSQKAQLGSHTLSSKTSSYSDFDMVAYYQKLQETTVSQDLKKQGAHGVVYLDNEKAFKKIDVTHPESIITSEINALLAEIHDYPEIQHPFLALPEQSVIASIFDQASKSVREFNFIQMPRIKGKTLDKIKPEETPKALLSFLIVFEHSLNFGFTHQDLTDSNILINEAGYTVFIDWDNISHKNIKEDCISYTLINLLNTLIDHLGNDHILLYLIDILIELNIIETPDLSKESMQKMRENDKPLFLKKLIRNYKTPSNYLTNEQFLTFVRRLILFPSLRSELNELLGKNILPEQQQFRLEAMLTENK